MFEVKLATVSATATQNSYKILCDVKINGIRASFLMDTGSTGSRPTEAPPENFTWGPLYPQAKCDFHPILHFTHIRAIFDERT